MGGTGYAQKVYLLGGENDEAVNVNEAGIFTQIAFPQYISFRFRVPADPDGIELPTIPCSLIIIRNVTSPTASDNDPIYICGVGQNDFGDDSMFLRHDESTQIYVENSNLIKICSDVAQDIRVQIYPSSATEVDLTQEPNVNLPYLDTVAPTVISTTPANTATNIERDVTVEKVMSEAIDPATVTTSTFTISPAPPAPGTWTVGIDTLDNTKLFLNPDSVLAATTTYTITLTTGVKDLSGNALAANSVTTFQTKAAAPGPDVTPPTITTKDPDSGATDVSITTSPIIIFSEDMDATTINGTTVNLIKVSNGNEVSSTISLGADKKTVTIDPDSLLYATTYEVQIIGGASGVKDLAGNALASTTTWQFTTQAQTYTVVYNVSSAHDNKLGGSHSDQIMEYVANSSSDLNDITPTKYVVRMRKVGSPTGTITVAIMDEDGDTITSFGTISAASLTTTNTDYTFTKADNITKLTVGCGIGVKYSGGDSSNYVIVRRNESNPFDGTNSYEVEEDGSGGTDHNTGYDVTGKIYVTP